MSNQIRILHMIGSLEYGGSQAMIINLYKAIDRDKIQFDFIMDKPQNDALLSVVKQLGARVYTLPYFKGNNYTEVKNAWDSFLKEHTEYKILHSHIRSYASIYLPIAKKYGLKTIIHSHSTSNGKGIKAIAKSIMQYPLRWQADYYFACSVKAGQWLFGNKIVKKDNFVVLKNAIDAKKFVYNDNQRIEAKNLLGIKDEFVLGFLGRVTEPKNPFFVIDVFKEICNIKDNCRLLFVGESDLLENIKTYAKQLGVIENIIFTGSREDTYLMYQAMDYFCFPSYWEGLGISLIEAQASGLKCICSENIPDEAKISQLVTTKSLSDGAKKWAEIIIDTCQYQRKNQYDLIVQNGYDIEENAEYIQDFYQKMLGNE